MDLSRRIGCDVPGTRVQARGAVLASLRVARPLGYRVLTEHFAIVLLGCGVRHRGTQRYQLCEWGKPPCSTSR